MQLKIQPRQALNVVVVAKYIVRSLSLRQLVLKRTLLPYNKTLRRMGLSAFLVMQVFGHPPS